MTQRVEGGLTYTQMSPRRYGDAFNVENQLASVTVSGQTATFTYDGDGNLVKKIKPDGSKAIYAGGAESTKVSTGSTQRWTKPPAGV